MKCTEPKCIKWWKTLKGDKTDSVEKLDKTDSVEKLDKTKDEDFVHCEADGCHNIFWSEEYGGVCSVCGKNYCDACYGTECKKDKSDPFCGQNRYCRTKCREKHKKRKNKVRDRVLKKLK